MARRVRQRFAQRADQVLTGVLGHLLVEGPDQPQGRGEPERTRHLFHHVQDPRAQAMLLGVAAGLEREDRRADLPDRLVQAVHGAAHPFARLRPGNQRHRALQRHPGGI